MERGKHGGRRRLDLLAQQLVPGLDRAPGRAEAYCGNIGTRVMCFTPRDCSAVNASCIEGLP